MNRYKYTVEFDNGEMNYGVTMAYSTAEARRGVEKKYKCYKYVKRITVWQAGKCE